MAKMYPNEELFEDGDKTLRFVANNGFGRAVNDHGKDIAIIFSELASGMVPVQDIENIMACGLVDIDGEKVSEGNATTIAGDLVSLYGLQQCSQLAFVLLSHIMLGEKKTSEITIEERREAMARTLLTGRLTSSKKIGLLWVAMFASSGLLACLSIRFFYPLIT